MPKKRECQICGRVAGTLKGRCGEDTDTKLGPVEKCELCKKWRCPDCAHENDCCFEDEEGDGFKCPVGWQEESNVGGYITYSRIEATKWTQTNAHA